ncbi:hypothetical protein [Tumebacillus flagellatus]|uniref:Uncharacterized protein n=1 Tax=Tumebacillus flagellatus TaxID=1157490 RepID=A0A074LLR2_9BACL|nr:hypothetical protein [Tumebacillus flagellatus]KEO82024.1 hypothetical protein EL26_17805 [Tumebacillus flagellatus]
MEDQNWFTLLRDTLNVFGNLAECIGLLFLVTQFRSSKKKPHPPKVRVVSKRKPEQTRERMVS